MTSRYEAETASHQDLIVGNSAFRSRGRPAASVAKGEKHAFQSPTRETKGSAEPVGTIQWSVTIAVSAKALFKIKKRG